MKKITMYGCITFLLLGFVFVVGCEDDIALPRANLIYTLAELSTHGFEATDNEYVQLYLELYLTVEETEGVGVYLEKESFVVEINGEFHSGISLDCSDIENNYSLLNCFLPGLHKKRSKGMSFNVEIEPEKLKKHQLFRIFVELTGTDENNHYINVDTIAQITVPWGPTP